jgi:hypothetical protein
MKKFIVIIMLVFVFVLANISTNAYAKINKNHNPKYGFSYSGFSMISSVSIKNIDRVFEYNLSNEFHKKYSNKIGFGYYVLHSGDKVIIMVNVYKVEHKGEILNALDAFSYTKKLRINMYHDNNFNSYVNRKIDDAFQHMAFNIEYHYLNYVKQVISGK